LETQKQNKNPSDITNICLYPYNGKTITYTNSNNNSNSNTVTISVAAAQLCLALEFSTWLDQV